MRRFHTSDRDFAAQFEQFVAQRRESDEDLRDRVSAIIERVRREGDRALAELTATFDGHGLESEADWRIDPAQCEQAYRALPNDLREALELAARRIADFHAGQMPTNRDERDAAGVRLGAIWRAVDAAGLYVPGGLAAYPSSLLMNAIPARVAGVERLVIATPTPGGEANPLVLAAAHIAGADEIWRVGGAQAIAALALGTERIAPVDVITGPGNAYVAEAKRQLYGTVGIDMVAGPSEILVIADGRNDPQWIAADLLSQAEHDESAQSILITDDADFAREVEVALDERLETLDTEARARESLTRHGAIIVVRDWNEAAELANRLAAEHVELAIEHPERLFEQIRHAGSVFLGRMTPEAIGDYVAGPNHVLPTGRRARFSSGLSVLDFLKRTSFIELDRSALQAIGPAAARLARAEGLPAHAQSVEIRLK